MRVISFMTFISIFCFVNFSLSCKVESSTHSAVADGTITIRNKEQQKQNVENLRRETKETLNKLDKIFDKDKIEEKQELAGLFSELSFNAIHNLSKNWTEEQKVMAHALVGYVSGELANSKNSFSTALTAGVNKFVTEEILKDEKTRLHYQEHPEELQWISAALGAAIGQMAGGDPTSGASIAASGTKNNLLRTDKLPEKVEVIYWNEELPHVGLKFSYDDNFNEELNYGNYGIQNMYSFEAIKSSDGGTIVDNNSSSYADNGILQGKAFVGETITDPLKIAKIVFQANEIMEQSNEFKNIDGSVMRDEKISALGSNTLDAAYKYNISFQGYTLWSNNCLTFVQEVMRGTDADVLKKNNFDLLKYFFFPNYRKEEK